MAGPAVVSTLLLRNVPLFSQLPEGQLALLTKVVTRKTFPRSTTIINAGDPTDALYIVISGRLKVMMSDDEGREVILAILGQGEFFGEMGLVDDAPRSATVIAIEPCELLVMSKADFKKCLAENFDICMGVMRGLVKRLRDADKKIGSLALMDVYGRVARLLLEMSETIDGQKPADRRLHRGQGRRHLPARQHPDGPLSSQHRSNLRRIPARATSVAARRGGSAASRTSLRRLAGLRIPRLDGRPLARGPLPAVP